MEEIKALTERTSDAIVSYIIKQELKEGERLPTETELMKILDVSRTTLREAIKMLASRNIVEARQGSGIFVSRNTGITDDPLGFVFIKDKKKLVSDLLEFRMMIEPRIAARAAINATQKDAEELEYLAREVEKMYELGKSHKTEDAKFHAKLGEISGNLVFPNLMPIIFQAIDMFIASTNAELKYETIDTHRAIVEAVKRNDPDAAEDAMMMHLIYNRNYLRNHNDRTID